MSKPALKAEDLPSAASALAQRPVWVVWEITRDAPEVPEGNGLRLRVLRRAVKGWAGPQRAVGLVDAARSSFAFDRGYYATLHIDGQEWRGASGAPVGRPYVQNPPDPTALSMLHAATEATELRAGAQQGVFSFDADLDGQHGAEFAGARLVRLTRHQDGRFDQLAFEDVELLPSFPDAHLPSWASDL